MDDHFSLVRIVRNVVEAVVGDQTPFMEEWERIRNVLMKALWPFDEARQAVYDALAGIGRMPEVSPS
jgi:hypothetical protein